MDENWAIYNYIVLIASDYRSGRDFADSHNLDEGTFRNILEAWKKEKAYQITLSTIYKICRNRNMNIFQFFHDVEKNKDIIVIYKED
ncbi:hypothetical protein [Winogradskyella sp.]|uniref:hypothetical protein n=1 Tax=Winogradskyella sp. TaxID=1883156 RepID=UPI003AB1D486